MWPEVNWQICSGTPNSTANGQLFYNGLFSSFTVHLVLELLDLSTYDETSIKEITVFPVYAPSAFNQVNRVESCASSLHKQIKIHT